MGIYREFNPLMNKSWTAVFVGKSMIRDGVNILNDAVDWCKGPMIHGRFASGYASSPTWGYYFFFKNRKDAVSFKLAWGGE